MDIIKEGSCPIFRSQDLDDRWMPFGVAAGPLIVLLECAAVVGILSTLNSDWLLGAIASNLSGYPSSDIAVLYWGYFIAKRLPIASV